MTNPCEYTASDFQELADVICTARTEIDNRLISLGTFVTAMNDTITDTNARVTTIENWIGNPGAAISVMHVINAIRSNVGDVDTHITAFQTDVDAKLGTLGPGQLSIAASVWNALTSETVASQVNQIEDDTDTLTANVVSLQGVLGSIIASVFGGGTSLIELATVIGSIWNAPPIDLVSRGPASALTTNTTITVPSGVYGYALDFDVPSFWGKRAGIPIEYVPFIARVGTTGPIGTLGTAIHVVLGEHILYPLPAGCHTVAVHLEPGVAGNYSELRFLGL
jgi:hypothetical protein